MINTNLNSILQELPRKNGDKDQAKSFKTPKDLLVEVVQKPNDYLDPKAIPYFMHKVGLSTP